MRGGPPSSRSCPATRALELGAHQTIDSRDAEEIKAAAGPLDLTLSTVNAKLDWNA
jgi:uncharacterized zinc-type alcohol dehydrogenase-like protein